MMELLRQWLLGITGAAILSAVAQSLMPEGGVKQVGRFVCGLVLAAAVLRPLNDPAASVWRFETEEEKLRVQAQQLQAERDAVMRAVIEEELAAYSMDKGAQLGIECRVSVSCVPGEEGIFLPGQVSIYGVSREEGVSLARVLQQDLGLREDQIRFQEGEGA